MTLRCETDLRAAVAAGVVPNTLFVEAKDRLNRLTEREAVEFLATGPAREGYATSVWSNVAYHADADFRGLHVLPATIRRAEKAKLPEYVAWLMGVALPRAELIAAAKPLVVKRGDARMPARPKTARQLAEEAKQMTCQCCGRGIFAATGVIAHHGYERPGYGWQTASCMGARYLPWEASRDRLGDLIEALKAQRTSLRLQLDRQQDETVPFAFTWTTRKRDPRNRFAMIDERHMREVTRSTFDALHAELAQPMDLQSIRSFDDIKGRAIADTRANLRNLMEYITECQTRYDGWQQTHRWDADAKVWLAVLTANRKEVA